LGIKIIGASKHYSSIHTPEGRVDALTNINLDINEGSSTLLFGPTGSGKTTLICLMGGIIKPSSGEVVLNGIHTTKSGDARVSIFREQNIGYIPQEALLIRDLTVFENILSPNAFYRGSIKELRSNAHFLLERLRLSQKISCMPLELSGGEIKKVMIARALLKNPRYLLADEPVSELDPDSADEALELIYEYHKRGTALVIASHKSLPMKEGSDLYCLDNGRISDYQKGGEP